MPMEYLSEDEQYAKILNTEQISRIKDSELRRIRKKYWDLRHKAFLNERGIPDAQLGDEWDRLTNLETEEIKKYRERKGDL